MVNERESGRRGSSVEIDTVSHQFAVAGTRRRTVADRLLGRPAPTPTRAQELGRLRVLTAVSLRIAAGEFVALLGPSGCGKSTLLRFLAGLDHPTRGTVRVDGIQVEGPDPHRALMFQDPTLFPWRTVEQNVALGPQARGTFPADRDEIAHTLNLVGLDGFRDSYPAQLSGGMAQRVALARALVNRPRLLLLDEPLGKLDALTRATLQVEIGRRWQTEGFTAALVTHDVDEALRLADRVVVLSARPGKVLREVRIELPRPREHDAPEYLRLRREIVALLGDPGRAVA